MLHTYQHHHPRPDRKLKEEGVENVLIIGSRLIGDAVQTLHAVKSLVAFLPGRNFDLLAAEQTAGLYRRVAPIRDFHAQGPGRVERIRAAGRKHDLAFILPGGFEWAFDAFRLGIPHRLGFRGDWRGFLLTGSALARRDVANWRNFLSLLATLPRVPVESFVHTVPQAPVPGLPAAFFAVAPGASEDAKRWPIDRWASLALEIHRRTGNVPLWIGGEAEKSLCEEGRRRAGGLNFAGLHPPEAMLGFLGLAKLTVSNNSGAAHLAALAGSPTAVLSGPSDPLFTRPWGERVTMITSNAPDVPRHRRGEKRHRSRLPMTALSVEEVLHRLFAEGALPRG